MDCDIGVLTNTQCHLKTFTNENSLYKLESLSDNDIELLKYRLDDYHKIVIENICEHHKCAWLSYYSNFLRYCCDPFKKHSWA